MSENAVLDTIGRELQTRTELGLAVDELLASRKESPILLGLGEPTHGVAAFPLLRNELLGQLVERGYRSVILETDFFAASLIDAYVNGADTDLDSVLASGFSHGFGSIPGNRELLVWLRGYNSARSPQDCLHFYGFDAPLEFSSAPSPRAALTAVIDFVPERLRPGSVDRLEELLGDDSDWSNEAVMYDAALSVGNSERARSLRIVADDLVGALRRAAPTLAQVDPRGFAVATDNARTAVGLLRYHAAMADSGPDRIGKLLSVRAEMMADNILAISDRERQRGPSLVFAHNVHLQHSVSEMSIGGENATWGSAGALVGLTLGERYVFLATDANPNSVPGTLQGSLAAATHRRALFPTTELRSTLPPEIGAGEPILPGHLPLSPDQLGGAEAVIFIADTDGKRHQYW